MTIYLGSLKKIRAAFTLIEEIDLILIISFQNFQGHSFSVLKREIGLTAALSLITGIDKKLKLYKDKSR